MRVLNCEKQPEQPSSEDETELVRFDVDYLLRCLGAERKKSYIIIECPDIQDRETAQPDYLVKDCKSDDLISIEHSRFFESQESKKNEATQVKRNGWIVSEIKCPTSQELGDRLSEFVHEKLKKSQFKNYRHTERILLARNRWAGVRLQHFIRANPTSPSNLDIDHFYLIIEHRLVEIF